MIKVVYNACYGGFGISQEGVSFLINDGVLSPTGSISRHHPSLVKMVETLGSNRASGAFASLAIEEIAGDRYRIVEYDGFESVETPESIEWIDATK